MSDFCNIVAYGEFGPHLEVALFSFALKEFNRALFSFALKNFNL